VYQFKISSLLKKSDWVHTGASTLFSGSTVDLNETYEAIKLRLLLELQLLQPGWQKTQTMKFSMEIVSVMWSLVQGPEIH
jgi:hypothetical protein